MTKTILAPALGFALAAGWLAWRAAEPAGAQPAEPARFAFFHEFYGTRAYTNPQIAAQLRRGMMNALTFSPPAEPGMWLPGLPYGVMLRMAGSPGPAALPEKAIEAERARFDALAAARPELHHYWNLLPEWDQGGGNWAPNGRPRYTGLTRAAARARFIETFLARHPSLTRWLAQPERERHYALASVTDYSSNVHAAYELGVELQMLERGIDELGDLSTGIAFLRGAAKQHQRPWGIDLSFWRTGNDRATEYNNAGVLLGGWSASYARRHYYISYLAGADVLHNEAVLYHTPNGQLSPLGEATREFADFALRRHRDVGQTVTPVALMAPYDQGFDPKHGLYNQKDAVWYQDLAYNDGDYMLDNLLRVAYPNHWLHGRTPGAPFNDASGIPDAARFRAYLASGGDPRPFEPMPTTRWGDNLDVITDQATPETLALYKVIVLAGEVRWTPALRDAVLDWVSRGGELVAAAGQLSSADLAPFGVASPPAGVVSMYARGAGRLHFIPQTFAQSADRRELSPLLTGLLDALSAKYMPARVEGPAIEFVVNQGAGRMLVGLVNNSGQLWRGRVIFATPAGSRTVREWVEERALVFETGEAGVAAEVIVPPYDVRVVVLE